VSLPLYGVKPSDPPTSAEVGAFVKAYMLESKDIAAEYRRNIETQMTGGYMASEGTYGQDLTYGAATEAVKSLTDFDLTVVIQKAQEDQAKRAAVDAVAYAAKVEQDQRKAVAAVKAVING
jgi:hypothetical protein